VIKPETITFIEPKHKLILPKRNEQADNKAIKAREALIVHKEISVMQLYVNHTNTISRRNNVMAF
jgi:hypothetical protein